MHQMPRAPDCKFLLSIGAWPPRAPLFRSTTTLEVSAMEKPTRVQKVRRKKKPNKAQRDKMRAHDADIFNEGFKMGYAMGLQQGKADALRA